MSRQSAATPKPPLLVCSIMAGANPWTPPQALPRHTSPQGPHYSYPPWSTCGSLSNLTSKTFGRLSVPEEYPKPSAPFGQAYNRMLRFSHSATWRSKAVRCQHHYAKRPLTKEAALETRRPVFYYHIPLPCKSFEHTACWST